MPALLAGPLMFLAIVVMLFTLPVTLPIAALLHNRDRARLRKAACGMLCVRCGHGLGSAAVDAADAALKKAMEAFHQQHPFAVLRRPARRPDARCVVCGTDYRWDSQLRKLVVVPHVSMP